MIAAIVALLLDATALARTAPQYLTAQDAIEHIVAAREAAIAYHVDEELLLSIAWHESRYQQHVVTREEGGKISCGVMTPEPTTHHEVCDLARSSLRDGYMHGAAHLRVWLDACHDNMRCALVGYAGGYRLLAACARGEHHRGCEVPAVFLGRAAWIKREKEHRGGQPRT